MAVTASVEYISTSVNRFNRSSAASSSSLVAFGSGKFVALWDSQVSFPLDHAVILTRRFRQSPVDRGVFATLPGHGGLVTCVEFIDDSRLLSADDTGSMRLWRKLNSSVRTSRNICVLHRVLNFLIALAVQWVPSPSIQAHSKSISALCSHAQAGCIVTGSSDSLLKSWKLGEQGAHHFILL